MRTRAAITAALAVLAFTTTACADSKPDYAACKTAMAKQLDDAMTDGTKGSRPAACAGVDAKTLQRYAGDITTDKLGKAIESALPTPSDTAGTDGITPDCRAWIERELTDGSESIDASSGGQACGYLSDDELNKAIDTVTDDLLAETP